MTRLFVLLALMLLTAGNVLYTSPWSAVACQCYNSDGSAKCSGNCCGGRGDACDCYDTGTDNCLKAVH